MKERKLCFYVRGYEREVEHDLKTDAEIALAIFDSIFPIFEENYKKCKDHIEKLSLVSNHIKFPLQINTSLLLQNCLKNKDTVKNQKEIVKVQNALRKIFDVIMNDKDAQYVYPFIRDRMLMISRGVDWNANPLNRPQSNKNFHSSNSKNSPI